MIFLEIEYKDLKNNKCFEIIDIRDKYEFEKGHLPQAKNIVFTELILHPDKYLKKDIPYLLICEMGIKSKKMSVILNNMGYRTYSLKNGIKCL